MFLIMQVTQAIIHYFALLQKNFNVPFFYYYNISIHEKYHFNNPIEKSFKIIFQ